METSLIFRCFANLQFFLSLLIIFVLDVYILAYFGLAPRAQQRRGCWGRDCSFANIIVVKEQGTLERSRIMDSRA